MVITPRSLVFVNVAYLGFKRSCPQLLLDQRVHFFSIVFGLHITLQPFSELVITCFVVLRCKSQYYKSWASSRLIDNILPRSLTFIPCVWSLR